MQQKIGWIALPTNSRIAANVFQPEQQSAPDIAVQSQLQ